MEPAPPAARAATPFLSALPLLVGFLAFPASGLVSRTLGLPLAGTWQDGVWLLLAWFAVMFSLYRGAGGESWKLPLLLAGLFLAVFFLLVRSGAPFLDARPLTAIRLRELRPAIYLLFAALWAWTFGPPGREAFRRAGLCLSALLIAEALALAVVNRALWRPAGSGDVSSDACLLLLALAACLDGERRLRDLGLVCAGLAASMGRPALFAAAWIVLFFGPMRLRWRWVWAAGLAGAAGISWLAGESPALQMERLGTLWAWLAGATLLIKDPARLLTGYSPVEPLPVVVPPELAAFWRSKGPVWSGDGPLPSALPAFWLRLTLTFGAWGPLAFLTAAALALARRLTPWSASLAAACLVAGMDSALFYSSQAAIPVGLAVLAALAPDNAAPASSG